MAAPRDKSHDESLAAALTDLAEATAVADAANELDDLAALPAGVARCADLERPVAEAYQAIGVLAADCGKFNGSTIPDLVNVLDYLSNSGDLSATRTFACGG
jgi:hypothetical protein